MYPNQTKTQNPKIVPRCQIVKVLTVLVSNLVVSVQLCWFHTDWTQKNFGQIRLYKIFLNYVPKPDKNPKS